ncbi:hypothetical protein TNCV_3005851 [Trichonephila clavipes]|nr:hypothetical protein TNCV_3005851 [Trichonephila clavipes]
MVLKANDRRTSCPCHDEFRGPRSDYVRQVALATTTTTFSEQKFADRPSHRTRSRKSTTWHAPRKYPAGVWDQFYFLRNNKYGKFMKDSSEP